MVIDIYTLTDSQSLTGIILYYMYPNIVLGDIADLDHPPRLHSRDLDGVGGQQVSDTTATKEFLHSIIRTWRQTNNLYA